MKRSKHSLSHYKLLTCDMGELVPIACFEVLPGDTIQQQTSLLIRLSPMLAPVMHPVVARVHHWFVPLRLIWDDFEKFITGGPDGLDATVPPYKELNGVTVAAGGLRDYFGIPPGTYPSQPYRMSMLPIRAYNLIWNEWYRDQDLQTELVNSTASGADTTSSVVLKKVAWEKDYFTSARPWPQKGAEVTIPLGGTHPITTSGVQPKFENQTNPIGNQGLELHTGGVQLRLDGAAGAADDVIVFGSPTGLQVDLSAASGASINELRQAFALQRYAEARARYGSRYTEYLRYLGVRSSDARLDRPEYLGGGKQVVQMSEVLQTGVTTSGTPNLGVGELKGHGIGALRSNRYRRFFEEHGIIISLLSIKPRTMYTQGINRMWTRTTREDYYQRELQHIGQQEITNREIFAIQAAEASTFGYQDRYDEYRRIESGVAGDFRSTLDFWHLARVFASAPTLNAAFVESTPSKRIHAVQTNDVIWAMANHSIQARRMLSKQGWSSSF